MKFSHTVVFAVAMAGMFIGLVIAQPAPAGCTLSAYTDYASYSTVGGMCSTDNIVKPTPTEPMICNCSIAADGGNGTLSMFQFPRWPSKQSIVMFYNAPVKADSSSGTAVGFMLDGTFDTGASNNLVFQVPATSDGSGVALFVNLTITTDDNGDKIQTMCFGGNPDVDPTPYGCANLSEDGQGSFDDAGFDITFVIADGKPNYQCYPNPAIEIDGTIPTTGGGSATKARLQACLVRDSIDEQEFAMFWYASSGANFVGLDGDVFCH